MERTIGKSPACVECAYVKLKPSQTAGEEVRVIDGRRFAFLCTRANDPLTGDSPEYCHTERQVGLCGPRGLFFEQGDGMAETMALLDDDEEIPMVGEALAEEADDEEVILD